MYQVNKKTETSSEPKLRPVELDCGKTRHLQRRESQRGRDATRHIIRSQRHLSALHAPAARLRRWLWTGDIACCPVGMGSEGRQQEALITYSQRPVLSLYLVLSSSPLPSHAACTKSARVHVQSSLPSPSVARRLKEDRRHLFNATESPEWNLFNATIAGLLLS